MCIYSQENLAQKPMIKERKNIKREKSQVQNEGT